MGRLKSKQNCYNAEKVLSAIAPSGEKELTQSYKFRTLSFVSK